MDACRSGKGSTHAEGGSVSARKSEKGGEDGLPPYVSTVSGVFHREKCGYIVCRTGLHSFVVLSKYLTLSKDSEQTQND
jgi:hypothetical protein